MSVIKVNNITSRDGTTGPVIAGIATVSTTSHLVVPTGNTGQKVALAPDPFINNLVLALPFNSESVFDDVSPRGVKASPSITGITTTASLPFGVSGVTTTSSGIVTFSKYYGSSIYFNGTSTGFEYSGPVYESALNWFEDDWTIEYWIYGSGASFATNSNGNTSTIGLTKTTATDEWWSFGPIGIGTVRFYFWSNTQNNFNSSSTIQTGTWNHLALVNNKQTLKIYINGVESGSRTIQPTANTSPPLIGTSSNLTIGRLTSSGAFNGYLQDLRIYKGVAKYTSNFTPPTQIAL
jgi:hypothetical protein